MRRYDEVSKSINNNTLRYVKIAMLLKNIKPIFLINFHLQYYVLRHSYIRCIQEGLIMYTSLILLTHAQKYLKINLSFIYLILRNKN